MAVGFEQEMLVNFLSRTKKNVFYNGMLRSNFKDFFFCGVNFSLVMETQTDESVEL